MPLGAKEEDILIKKILIGAPAAAGTITVYNKTAVVNGDTDNIAFKLTEPTAAAGSNLISVVDFTGPKCNGLQVNGGNVVVTGSNMGVTVIYSLLSEEAEG
jgi:hypothetical protein